MAVGVAAGPDYSSPSLGVHAQETVGASSGYRSVNGHLYIAICPVLEPHWHTKTAGHLAVSLAFGGAGADGSPTDQVGQILGDDGVEELRPCVNTHVRQFQEQTASPPETGFNVVAMVSEDRR